MRTTSGTDATVLLQYSGEFSLRIIKNSHSPNYTDVIWRIDYFAMLDDENALCQCQCHDTVTTRGVSLVAIHNDRAKNVTLWITSIASDFVMTKQRNDETRYANATAKCFRLRTDYDCRHRDTVTTSRFIGVAIHNEQS